jgi:hypothetical protein
VSPDRRASAGCDDLTPAARSTRFDDPNLVSCAGLVPVLALADRYGLTRLLLDRLTITMEGGANAAAKILAIVAGRICGADSITDLDLLRHGGMPRLVDGVRAPSTLGTFLRLLRFGHVRQLDAVAARLLTRLATDTRSCPTATRWCSSTSTTLCARPTATPSRAPDAATPASRDSTHCSRRCRHRCPRR